MNKGNYQAINTEDNQAVDVEANSNAQTATAASWFDKMVAENYYARWGLFWLVFVVIFAFYGYCVFHTFAPKPIFDVVFNNPITHTRMLGESIASNTTTSSVTVTNQCTATGALTLVGVGAVGGAAVIAGAFIGIGLMPFMGPIAGGAFAANMGAAVAAGSTMAVAQSAAMTASTFATAAALGASAVPALACLGISSAQ